MDRKLIEVVTRNALARRGDQIQTAVAGFFLDELSESDLTGRLRGIFRDEKERLTAPEIHGIMGSGVGEKFEEPELTPV